MSFSRAEDPGRAFGMNIAGAMVGGLSENSSMLLGFQYVAVVALIFYALSWVSARSWLGEEPVAAIPGFSPTAPEGVASASEPG